MQDLAEEQLLETCNYCELPTDFCECGEKINLYNIHKINRYFMGLPLRAKYEEVAAGSCVLLVAVFFIAATSYMLFGLL